MTRDLIHQYLEALSNYLARLDKYDADEVVREIESHIYDVIELQKQQGGEVDINSILEGFGSPRELAAQYVEHILDGTAPPAGFRAIRRIKKGVGHGLYFSMAVFGYTTSLIFILLGLGKIIVPDYIGFWAASEGNSVIISFAEQSEFTSNELMGYWIIPVGIGVGAALFWLTKRVLHVLKLSMKSL